MENNKQVNKDEIKFIYIEVDEETKEIKQLLDRGLIKYVYGKNCGETDFVYLAKNEDIIKNTLKSNFWIKDIIEQIFIMFEGRYMILKNDWDDEVQLSFDRIFNLIKDDLNSYIPENKQQEIFNVNNPSEKIDEIINEIGRNQFRVQVESFIIDVDKVKF